MLRRARFEGLAKIRESGLGLNAFQSILSLPLAMQGFHLAWIKA